MQEIEIRKIGRRNDMPTVGLGGDMVSFPYDADGIKAAEKYAQATGQTVNYSDEKTQEAGLRSNITLGYEEGGKVPETNAPDKRESYQLGGMPGDPGFGQRPSPIVNPRVPVPPLYKKGGKVKK